jgi:hypothetical protein
MRSPITHDMCEGAVVALEIGLETMVDLGGSWVPPAVTETLKIITLLLRLQAALPRRGC